MSYTAQIPEIDSASFSPNPVSMNSSVLVKVFISEKTVFLTPSYMYSGEVYTGEV